jgi:hypothetical protein
MNYQQEFNSGYAGNGLPNDPDALAAWNAGVRTREENERIGRANAADATELSFFLPALGGPEAAGGATTSGWPWALALVAFVVFAPITLPATAATPFAALALVASCHAPRPAFPRALGAAFLGLLAYFAIVGGMLAPRFPAAAIERVSSVASLLALLAPQVGALVMAQLVAVSGYAVVAAWRLAGGVPSPGLVARAFIAGVIGLLAFIACLVALAPVLGLS